MNENRQILLTDCKEIMVNSLGYWPTLEAALPKDVFDYVVEAFINLAFTESNGMDSHFGVSLRKIFQNYIIEAELTTSDLEDHKMMKEQINLYVKQYNIKMNNELQYSEIKIFKNFWFDSSEASHAHKFRDFYKKNWRPFLQIIDIHYNLGLHHSDFNTDPFDGEMFEEIKGLVSKRLVSDNSINNEEVFKLDDINEQLAKTKELNRPKFPEGKKFWGIDLGTNNSAISYYISPGVFGTIKFNGKDSITSSVVIDEEGGAYAITNYTFQGISATKTIENETIVSGWKVKTMDSSLANKPYIAGKNEWDHITPVYLSSLVLEKLISEAEKQTGEKIEDLVITVPASFTQLGIENTRNALKMTGREELAKNVLIFPEPVAAMFSTLNEASNAKVAVVGKWYSKKPVELFAVFDMGAGTTDVSVVNRKSKEGKVSLLEKMSSEINLELHGNAGFNVAGRTIDKLIVDNYLSPAVESKTGNSIKMLINSHKDKNEKMKEDEYWMKLAEEIKEFLSSNQDDYQEKRPVLIKNDKEIISISINYNDFKQDVLQLISIALRKIEEGVSKSKNNITDIDHFVLAGGSSQAPWIRELISEHYPDLASKLSNVNPQYAISLGAAIYCNVSKNTKRGINVNSRIESTASKGGIELSNVTLNNYGISQYKNDVSWIIESGTTMPTPTKVASYTFKGDITDSILFEIVEADKKFPWKYMSKLICSFEAINHRVSPGFKLKMSKDGDVFKMEIQQGDFTDVYHVDPASEEFRNRLEKFNNEKEFRILFAQKRLKTKIKNVDDRFDEQVAFLEKFEGAVHRDVRNSIKELVNIKKFLSDEEKEMTIMFLEEYCSEI